MISHFWQTHRALLVAFAFAAIAMLWFGYQTITHTLYWNDPAHRDQAIAGWMTLRYVANSYTVPPDVLGAALYLDPQEMQPRQTLQEIADTKSLTIADLQVRIDFAVADWRSTHPVPGQ